MTQQADSPTPHVPVRRSWRKLVVILGGIVMAALLAATLYVPERPLFHNQLSEWPIRVWVPLKIRSVNVREQAFVDNELNILVLVRLNKNEADALQTWTGAMQPLSDDVYDFSSEKAVFQAGGAFHTVTTDDADRLVIIDHRDGPSRIAIEPGVAQALAPTLRSKGYRSALSEILISELGQDIPEIKALSNGAQKAR